MLYRTLTTLLLSTLTVAACTAETDLSEDDIRGGQAVAGAQPIALQGVITSDASGKSKWKPISGSGSFQLEGGDGNAFLIASDVVLNLNADEDFKPTTVETPIVDQHSLEWIDAPPINGFPHNQKRKAFVFGGDVDVATSGPLLMKLGATTKVFVEKQRRPNVVQLDANVPGVRPWIVSANAPVDGERCRVIGYDLKNRPTIREVQVTMEAPSSLGFGGMEGPSDFSQGLASWSDAILCNGELKAIATSSHTYSVINKSALNSQLRSMGHAPLP